jgi:hypothetical protein
MLFTIAKPKPVPLDKEFSCAKGVKSFDRINSGEIPFPVSVTVRMTIDLGIISPVSVSWKSSIGVEDNLIFT